MFNPACRDLLAVVTSPRGSSVDDVRAALSRARASGVHEPRDCQGTRFGGSPLTLAARAGNAPAVRELLSLPCPVDDADKHGLTGLAHSCQHGHFTVVDMLLAHGADPASVDQFGLTPVHKASAFGHQSVLERVLAGGGDPNVPAGAVTAPIEYEAQASRGARPLHCVANSSWAVPDGSRRREMVRTLLAFGADPTLRDDEGNTPLHRCAESCDLSVCWTLLRESSAADPLAKNNRRQRPVDLVPPAFMSAAAAGSGGGGYQAREGLERATPVLLAGLLRWYAFWR